MNGLLELLTNKHWMIHPDFVQAARPMIQQNLNGHIALAEEKKVMATAIPVTKSDNPSDVFQDSRISIINGRPVYSWDDEHKNDPFINLMYVDGPITRNGGACTYGSVELRDIMMRAADDEHCVGHIFFINTPGGSAWAKNDFRQAIDYAHERKQPVNAFIDGMCCSAGMYLASMCDERYYMHPKDQVGCIGVMAAFYTEKDGSYCEYTNETYHELYDPESFDKNKEMRDIANDGNSELLINELTALGVEFRADIMAACPKAKEDHLHGKVFDAQDVKGILMDGQMNLSEVFDRTVKMGKHNGVAALASATAQPTTSARMAAGTAKEAILNPLNNSNMKEKFPNVFALLGVEEMECSEEGSFFNAGLLQTLEGKIGEMQSANAEAKALVEQLTAEKATLEQQLTEKDGQTAQQLAEKDGQMEQLKADHQAAVETLKAEHEKALGDMEGKHKEAIAANAALLEEKDKTIKELTEAVEGYKQAEVVNAENMQKLQQNLDGAQASLETATQTIAERDQQISDLTAQVEELTKEPGNEPQAGAAPQNNGGGAEAPTVAVNQYVYDKSKSYKDNMEAMEKWNTEHGK